MLRPCNCPNIFEMKKEMIGLSDKNAIFFAVNIITLLQITININAIES